LKIVAYRLKIKKVVQWTPLSPTQVLSVHSKGNLNSTPLFRHPRQQLFRPDNLASMT